MTGLTFRRGDGWADRLRAYRIFVDGEQRAEINRNSEVAVATSAGRHRVQLKIDWASSPAIEVDVRNGKSEIIECRSNVKLALILLYITFLRHKYLSIAHRPDLS